jgi:DNA-binding PadR family transcriptional regulator
LHIYKLEYIILNMSTRLVILGLLRDKPLYGYEIKQIIEEHMNDWTSIAFGSIYFALDKLADEGLIEKIATEQEGNRPSRSVYQITSGGVNEFFHLLRDTWSEVERSYYSLDIGLFFFSALPPAEIKSYVQERIQYLQSALQHLPDHESSAMKDDRVPPVARAIFSHSIIHLKAELEWTRDLLSRIENGEYF